MTDKNLKTYLASIGAVQVRPGIIITKQGEGLLSCEVDTTTNPHGKFAVAFAHDSRLLVRYEEAEAMEDSLSNAHDLFPEETGWTNHTVYLHEIPRSMFIEMQLFTGVREIYDRLLRLIGLRATASS